MHYYTKFKKFNLSSSIENLESISKINKSKLKWVEIQRLDKQLPTPTLEDVFVLNWFELNLKKLVKKKKKVRS